MDTTTAPSAAIPQIAVISSNTLTACGLVSLIESVIPVAETRVFHELSDIDANELDKFFHFFITSEILMQNTAFFTERCRKTIVISTSPQHSSIPKCFKTIDATLDEKNLLRAFLQMEQMAHSGGRRMPQEVRSETNKTFASTTLTPREVEVLREIVKGFINKEIADRLNISLTTVISHRRNIMEKLHAKSVSALTVFAVMHGIISVDDI